MGFPNRIDLMILPTADRVPGSAGVSTALRPTSRPLFWRGKHAGKMPVLPHHETGCPIL